jgi:glycosyltransferase involved in cell wall biosynthesis
MENQSNQLCFVIPAYGDSPFLEDCISSLKNQSIKASIILATSKPTQFIEEIATNHNLPLKINSDGGGIAADWNFALQQGGDQLVVLAHQDDVYYEDYSSRVLEMFQRNPDLGIAFSDSSEMIDDIEHQYPKRELIKRVLREFAFLRAKVVRTRAAKYRLLCLGCPIPCPSVVFNRSVIPEFRFSTDFVINLDWEAWTRISNLAAPIGYMRGNLVKHRIHAKSETQAALSDNRRSDEDMRMFLRFWPKSIAKILHFFYRMGYH